MTHYEQRTVKDTETQTHSSKIQGNGQRISIQLKNGHKQKNAAKIFRATAEKR